MANERIMIVEDSSMVSLHIKYVLERASFKVVSQVATGEEAVIAADRELLDLILMDIMLAGAMDGITVSTLILKKANIPIIFLSAYSDRQTIESAKATAPYSYIIKPFDERDLITRIELALYKHTLENKLIRQRISILIEGQEFERERVSRELHDGLGQLLNAIRINLDTADHQNFETIFNKVYALTEEAISESRRITENLLPSRILDFDITTSFAALCKQMNNDKIEVIFQKNEFTSAISTEQKLGLYRIAQECLQNSIKHSGCSKIFVQLYDYEDYLHLCIEDNGKGYDENLVSKGKGLNNILYRVLALNGKIQTESNFDNGTFVSVTIPLLKDEND